MALLVAVLGGAVVAAQGSVLPPRLAALAKELSRCSHRPWEEGPESNVSDAEAIAEALGCLQGQWYPPPQSPELASALYLDQALEAGGETPLPGALTPVLEASPRSALALATAVDKLTGEPLQDSDVFYQLGPGIGRLPVEVYLTSAVRSARGVQAGWRRALLAKSVGRAVNAAILGGDASVVYGVGAQDGQVYTQALRSLTPPRAASTGSEWRLAIGGRVKAIAVKNNEIFAVREDNRVYRQFLPTASPAHDAWQLASAGSVQDIVIDEDIIYAVGSDRRIWKQELETMTVNTSWTLAGMGSVISAAVDTAGDTMYGVGTDLQVYKQPLSTLSPKSPWIPAAKGTIDRLAIHNGRAYGVAYDTRIWSQPLATMTVETDWQVASRDGVASVAFSFHSFHGDVEGTPTPVQFSLGELATAAEGMDDATVVYISSLLFESDKLFGLAQALASSLRPGALILSERTLPGCFPTLLPLGRSAVEVAGTALTASGYIVLPSPTLPQPSWLPKEKPALEAFLAHFGGSWDAMGATVPRAQWLAAAKRAWPGSEELMLDRLLGSLRKASEAEKTPEAKPVEVEEDLAAAAEVAVEAAAEAAAPASSEEQIDVALLQRAILGLGRSEVACAWQSLSLAARLPQQQPEQSPQNGTQNATATRQKQLWESVLERMGEVTKGDPNLLSMVAAANETLASQVLPALLARAEVRQALAKSPSTAGSPSTSPLHRAIEAGNLEVTKKLLEAGASPAGEAGQTTPLHAAAVHGRLQIAEELIRRGASKDFPDEFGRVPLQVASRANLNLTNALRSESRVSLA